MLYGNVHEFTVNQVQEILYAQNCLFHSLFYKQKKNETEF